MFSSIKNFFVARGLVTSLQLALLTMLALSTQALAVDVIPKKSLEQKANPQESASKDATWLHLEPSIRPVYVGIHGGTAPVTLLRGDDGSVYAITGQTGNDFILALRSGNASVQKSSNASISEVVSTNEQMNFLDFSREAVKEDISVYERWGDSIQWMATLKAYSTREENQKLATNEIIQPKPKDYPEVVFTSGEKFKRIAEKTEDLQSFGFSDSDMPPATSLNGTRFSNKALILELKDYRDVLSSL